MAAKLDEIEKRLWSIMDGLRASLKTSEYSEPILGLIFLRFASECFKKATAEILAERPEGYEITDDDYLERGALIIPQDAQFDKLLNMPEETDMSKTLNEAMSTIEEKNENLKGSLPRSFPRLTTDNIFALLKSLDSISFDIEDDIFGKIYEYFLSEFAMAEGQRGSLFFTPTSIVQLIVEIVEPFKGCIFDPACGSGGIFVQSARFVRNHQRQLNDISIWGQEVTEETARLCRINLAVNRLVGTIRTTNSLYGDLHPLWGQFDYVMANPPFNVSGVDKTKLKGENERYPFGLPNRDNANYLWIQMFYSALNDRGRAGFVMANSASDALGSELDIRRELLQKKAVDVIISIGSNFLYNVTLPCTLWFFDKDKIGTPRENTVLIIDARDIYHQIDRAQKELQPEDREFITNIVRLYREEAVENAFGSQTNIREKFPDKKYKDIANLCKAVTLEEIAAQNWSLNPARYIDPLIPPEGFEQVKLHEIAEMLRGITLKRNDFANKSSKVSETINNSEIYIVRSRNIQDNGNLDIDSLEKINLTDINTTFTRALVTKNLLQPNDILVAALGNARNIPVAIVNHTIPENVVFTNSLIRIRVTSTDYVDPKSVFTFLKSETGQLMMRDYAGSLGGNLPRISPSSIRQISVFFPSQSHESKVENSELSSLSQVILQLKNDILPALERAEQANNQIQFVSQHMEIAGKLKELAYILSPPSLADKVINSYPMPIALAYRRFLEAQFNIYEHVLRLKDLFEATGFFIYNVVLADALQRLDPNQYKITNNGARKAYNGYSMSARMDFVSDIINIAKANNGKDLFLPELMQSSIVTPAKELQDDLRNALSHTATASASRQNFILKKYQPLVEDMLAQLEFLANYPLMRLPSFYIKRGKLVYRIESYSGVMLKVEEKEISNSSEPIQAEHDHIILMDRDNQVLDLHPLYQLLANEDTRHEPHLCFFKQRKEADKRLEGESVQGAFNINLDGFEDFKTL